METGMIKRGSGAVSLMEIRLHPERYPRLKDIPEEQAVTALKQIVVTATMYRGQEIDESKADFTARTLRTELMEETQYGAQFVTLEEIRRAVKKAVLEDADLYGINVASLYKVILNYVKGEGHAADNSAHEYVKAQRRAIAQGRAADTMLQVYAGKLNNNFKTK